MSEAITLYNPFISATHAINQDTFSDDLSKALQIFKKRITFITNLTLHPSASINSDQQLYRQAQLIVQKYRQTQTNHPPFSKIFLRFITRIRQSSRLLFRTKLPVLSLLKRVQAYLDNPHPNHHEFLNNILVLIPQEYKCALHLSSRAKTLTPKPPPIEHIEIVPPRPKESQVLLESLKIYNCIDVDLEHIRKIYFDLQAYPLETEIQIRFHNRHISTAIHAYEREYERKNRNRHVKQRKVVEREVRCAPKRQMTATCRQSEPQCRQSEPQCIETIATSKTFRMLYQEKTIQRREHTVKIKNIVMGREPFANQVNQKRKDFYRKTQNNLKIKCNYIYRKKPSVFDPYATINPQLCTKTVKLTNIGSFTNA